MATGPPTSPTASAWQRLKAGLTRAVSLADDPADSDDLRLRKRVGIAVGYIAMTSSLARVIGLAVVGENRPVVWAVSLLFTIIIGSDIIFVARTRQLAAYVLVLVVVSLPVAIIGSLGMGGLGASSGSILWLMVLPVVALLLLGPHLAVPVFVLYVVAILVSLTLDPLVAGAAPLPPYPIRLALYGFNLLGVGLIVFLVLRATDIRRRAAEARSEELLTNAIPAAIATRLRRGEKRIAEVYPATTVLFSDLVGFTPWAGRTDPDQVVSFLDDLFSRFDALAATSGVEKIKTIGDSYMAVSGAPVARDDHAQAALVLARGMLRILADARDRLGLELDVRIGVASGPVVGGVIGQKRLLFDLWGDTVNLASRMESSGVPGRIQVAPSSWALLRDDYAFDEREGVEVKGLGVMTTYLLAEPTEG